MYKTNLVNDQMVSDIANKIQTKSQSYADTNTDMRVSMFANDEKLIDSDKRLGYDDNVNDNYEDKLDDDVDNYKKNDDKHVFMTHHSPNNNQRQDSPYNRSPQHNNTPLPKEHNKEYDTENQSQLSKEEMLLKKLDMLRKLGELSQYGVKLSQNYSINSDYNTMKFEYDLHTGIRSKQNTINWMGNMMIGVVKGIELLNDNANPFDMKFENQWSNKIVHDITDYYDVLGEIYEKYTSPGKKMAPELKLFLMLSGSAISIQMHKGLTSMSKTNVSNELDEDPNLIKSLRRKTDEINSKGADTETSSIKRRNILNERIQKEHIEAMKKSSDLQLIQNSQKQYNDIQNMATQNDKMAKFGNSLLLSESAKSARSVASNKEFAEQNKTLLSIQNALNNMRNEEKVIKSNNDKRQIQSKRPRQLKKTEQKSDDSSMSSKSTLSINPNIDKILGNQHNPTKTTNPSKSTKQDSDSSSLSSSVSSSVSSISFTKKGIVVTLANNGEKSDAKSDSSSKVAQKKEQNNVTEINFESISFGKKSNGSNKKKGGNMKIGLGNKK